MNIYPSSHKDGYFFRVLNIHVKYFAGFNDDSLKKALKYRNEFYFESKFLPESIFIRETSDEIISETNSSGYAGIYEGVANNRNDLARLICVKLRSFYTRKQINKRFILDGSSFKNSEALKEAIKIRIKNIDQINMIVLEYNKLRFNHVFPHAIFEQKTLIPMLYKLNEFDLKTWETASKNIFPRGFINAYTVKTR